MALDAKYLTCSKCGRKPPESTQFFAVDTEGRRCVYCQVEFLDLQVDALRKTHAACDGLLKDRVDRIEDLKSQLRQLGQRVSPATEPCACPEFCTYHARARFDEMNRLNGQLLDTLKTVDNMLAKDGYHDQDCSRTIDGCDCYTGVIRRKISGIQKDTESPKEQDGNPWAPNKDYPGKPVKGQDPGKEEAMWKVLGYDEFSNEWYGLGEFATESEAKAHAQQKLAELEVHQPTQSSGGQGFYGIQDRVWIEGPDGSRNRVYPELKRPSKEEILKRFENLSPENRKEALRIIDENMGLANRKHDLGLLVDLGYSDLSAIRMNEILEAVKKGGV